MAGQLQRTVAPVTGLGPLSEAIVYIVTRPRHMTINELLIRPTEQAG